MRGHGLGHVPPAEIDNDQDAGRATLLDPRHLAEQIAVELGAVHEVEGADIGAGNETPGSTTGETFGKASVKATGKAADAA
ncbi:hypothetical protein AB0K09_28405, partial [Streptomyces sp. NPDC049577]|uniref:hypothetical protein n=1 Tax=Streptomyces sp. NPDC049577 TaxID=3155153 RepID=UPI003413F6D4